MISLFNIPKAYTVISPLGPSVFWIPPLRSLITQITTLSTIRVNGLPYYFNPDVNYNQPVVLSRGMKAYFGLRYQIVA